MKFESGVIAGAVAQGEGKSPRIGGVAGWLMRKLNSKQRDSQRLALLDRITLAPRQSLALIEAEGRRILVATSAEGGPSFYPLDDRFGTMTQGTARRRAPRQARVSW
jgi:flagellar biogenesis protein FliO